MPPMIKASGYSYLWDLDRRPFLKAANRPQRHVRPMLPNALMSGLFEG